MTAEQKAKELVEKFYDSPYLQEEQAKRCALITVEGMIVIAKELFNKYGIGFLGTAEIRHDISKWKFYKELQQVKEEINKL